jgi:hypothetical protein
MRSKGGTNRVALLWLKTLGSSWSLDVRENPRGGRSLLPRLDPLFQFEVESPEQQQVLRHILLMFVLESPVP